jgi:hypothetical protein
MLQAFAPVESEGSCWTPGAEDAHKTAKARDTTIKSWWQLSEENSEVATPRGHKDGHEDGAAGYSWSRISAASEDTTVKSSWQLSEESSEVSTPRGLEDAHKTAKARDTTTKPWWQLSEENSAVATPRGRDDGHEDGAAGYSWSRIRTPSPEGRYVLHDVPAAGTSQFSMLPLPAQQWHTQYPEAPLLLAMAVVPPPPQPLLLADVLQRESAECDQGPSDKACWRRLHREERLKPSVISDVLGQAPADAHVLSIGSEGHPHSCAMPCKYSRGGRVCKDGAACSRCHLCPWTRSGKRAAQ